MLSTWPSRWRAASSARREIVSADETEGGLRMVLNYGHTLAHALEAAGFAGESGDVEDADAAGTGGNHKDSPPLLRHGEAVAIGLVFAARLARALGRIDEQRVARHRADRDALRAAGPPPGRRRPCTARRAHGPGQEGDGGSHLRARRAPRRRARPSRSRPPLSSRGVGRTPMNDRRLLLLLSGPNLQLFGQREPEVYGTETLPARVERATCSGWAFWLSASNTSRATPSRVLVGAVHGARGRAAAIIVNGGALSHYGWSLHDALAAFEGVIVELHVSNPQRPRTVAAAFGARCRWPTASWRASAGSATSWPSRPQPACSPTGRRPRRPADPRPLEEQRLPLEFPPCPMAAIARPCRPWTWQGGSAGCAPRIAAAACEALLVTSLVNVRYLTGFSGSAGMLLVTQDTPCSCPTGATGTRRGRAARQRASR